MRLVSWLAFGLWAGAAFAGDAVIPFTIQQFDGARPIVTIAVNGHRFPAIVHSNAGLYLQINHAQAAAVGVQNLTHRDSYGIEAAGKVSKLGRDSGTVARLAVGDALAQDVPVSVFEKPVDVTMLGLDWIAAHRVILDYPASTITVPGDASTPASLRTRLLAAGYRAIAMRRDASDGRYLVTATIHGVSAEMVVSSVVDAVIDTDFAARAQLRTGAVTGTYGGPSGATGNEYETAEPVRIALGAWQSIPRKLPLEDTYAYMKAERPAVSRGGYLGADFLIAHRAVIDFGSLTLYVH